MINRVAYVVASVVLVGFVSWSPNQAQTGLCKTPPPEAIPEHYPAHHLSPRESLSTFDNVFYAEVVVPSRPCSIGHCAGVKVLRRIKGDLPQTVLLRVQRPGESVCGPANFNHKGARWVVFANRGTSRGGQTYLQADDDSPTFPAKVVPDFDALETRYRILRARLDAAIDERLGRVRHGTL